MTRPSHAGLRHLALNVTHLEEMQRFYTELLGYTIEWAPDPDNLYLTSGIDNLALHRVPGTLSPPEAGGRLDHLGLIVCEAEDVDRWAVFLESHGVAMQAKPRTHRDGARSCYFRDPDGNVVQIIHHPPISGKA